jgi:hypothetical protein
MVSTTSVARPATREASEAEADSGGEKRKGINSWTNARVKAKARLGDREDAEDTVE